MSSQSCLICDICGLHVADSERKKMARIDVLYDESKPGYTHIDCCVKHSSEVIGTLVSKIITSLLKEGWRVDGERGEGGV